MLKGIPKVISPELLKALDEMGHSDTLVIADGNFPVHSKGKNARVVHCDGHGVEVILDAVLQLFPLDTYVDSPVKLMEVMSGDPVKTPIWKSYEKIIEKYDQRGKDAIAYVERFAYYELAKEAYLIIATSESALYGNIILQKGALSDE